MATRMAKGSKIAQARFSARTRLIRTPMEVITSDMTCWPSAASAAERYCARSGSGSAPKRH